MRYIPWIILLIIVTTPVHAERIIAFGDKKGQAVKDTHEETMQNTAKQLELLQQILAELQKQNKMLEEQHQLLMKQPEQQQNLVKATLKGIDMLLEKHLKHEQ